MAEQPPGRRGFWQRFSEQETGPQKVIVGLAGTMTAVATAIGGVYAVANLMSNDPPQTSSAGSGTGSTATPSPSGSPGPSSTSTTPSDDPAATPTAATTVDGLTLRPGQTVITQGSPEADAFIRSFLEPPGGRVDLDVVVMPERKDTQPQWIMRLWYNCHGLPAGQPPGEDLCDSAMLVFDDADPPPARFDQPRRIEMRGTWADDRPSGLGYGARGLEIYPVPASF